MSEKILPVPPKGESLLKKLNWSVEWIGKNNISTLYVESYPLEQRHCITYPVGRQEPIRWLEVQHELAHCLLAETVHPFFAGQSFSPETPLELLEIITPLLRCATDWYADAIIYHLWPKDGINEIEEHCRLFLQYPPYRVMPPDMTWSMALFYAQLIHYGGHNGLKKKIRKKAPELDMLAKIYLNYSPENPSLKTLVRLINHLLKIATRNTCQVSVELHDLGEVFNIFSRHVDYPPKK